MQLSFPSVPTDPSAAGTAGVAGTAAADAIDAFGAIIGAAGSPAPGTGFAEIFGGMTSTGPDAPAGTGEAEFPALPAGPGKKTPATAVEAQAWNVLFVPQPLPVETAASPAPEDEAGVVETSELLTDAAAGASTTGRFSAGSVLTQNAVAIAPAPAVFSADVTPASSADPVDSPAGYRRDNADPKTGDADEPLVSVEDSVVARDAGNSVHPASNQPATSNNQARAGSDLPPGIVVARERVPLDKIAPTAAPVAETKWPSSVEPGAPVADAIAPAQGDDVPVATSPETELETAMADVDSLGTTPVTGEETPGYDGQQTARTSAHLRARVVTAAARFERHDSPATATISTSFPSLPDGANVRSDFVARVAAGAAATIPAARAAQPLVPESQPRDAGITSLSDVSTSVESQDDAPVLPVAPEAEFEQSQHAQGDAAPRTRSTVAPEVQPVIRLAPQLVREVVKSAPETTSPLPLVAANAAPWAGAVRIAEGDPRQTFAAHLVLPADTEAAPVADASEAGHSEDSSTFDVQPVDPRQGVAVSRASFGRPLDPLPAAPLPAAKFAEAFAGPAQQARTPVKAAFKNLLPTEEQEVSDRKASVGTAVAKPDVAMSAPANAPLKPVAPVHDGAVVVAGISATQDASVTPTAAPAEAPGRTAQHAVEAVLSAVERFSSGERHAVNLAFSIGGSDLHVRVEMRADEVRTAFHTTSPELRAALAQEWQTVASQAGDRGVRFSDPVFSSQQNGGHGHSGAHADGGWQQRESASRREFAESFATFASGAQSDEDEVATPAPRSIADRWTNSRRLQTFA
jgi:hypothetical protein